MKKSKAENRYPKEGRSPKAEVGGHMHGLAFSCSEAESSAEVSELKESGAAPSSPQPRDLLERTALFAESVIRFAKQIPRGPVTNRLIDQVVGAGSSVAANYCEADDAVSGRDFKKSIGTCRKESKETMLFLRLIGTTCEDLAPEARRLWREAKELNLIFGAMWRK